MASLSQNAFTDKNTLARYMQLEQPENQVQVLYIWIDGSLENLRGKTRTLDFEPKSPDGKKYIHLSCKEDETI